MIRFAVALTIISWMLHPHLPKVRAEITAPFFRTCLKIAPESVHQNKVQSLVCGLALNSKQPDSGFASWRDLGLIHILVVSGGHLVILASVIEVLARLFLKPGRTRSLLTTGVLILFALGNRLQPPVLRSLLDILLRSRLERRGWRGNEVALISTWIALPFSSSIYDLLSLALSFFASVAVAGANQSFQSQKRWLSAVALQLSVWWILLPFLFTMGIPHPLTALVNIAMAPLLGATLIPLAMLTWLSGIVPHFSLGHVFDFVWEKLTTFIKVLANCLPAATPQISGIKPLVFGLEATAVLLLVIFSATGALMIRSRRVRRKCGRKNKATLWFGVAFGFFIAILVYDELLKLGMV